MSYFRPVLNAHGVTEQQWRVLRVLHEHTELESGSLADIASILPPSLTGILARLDGHGLVHRRKDAADQRRSVRVADRARPGPISCNQRRRRARLRRHQARLGRKRLQELCEMLDEVCRLALRRRCAPLPDRQHGGDEHKIRTVKRHSWPLTSTCGGATVGAMGFSGQFTPILGKLFDAPGLRTRTAKRTAVELAGPDIASPDPGTCRPRRS